MPGYYRSFPRLATTVARPLLCWFTFALVFVGSQTAQELARRLILKDGSYQLVTRYEVKGDRVRYFSAEREDWEELPSSLVDWPATDKFEHDRAAAAAAPAAVQLDKESLQEEEREAIQQPEVVPGLRLPMDSGVFLLDAFEGGPQLVEIQQNEGDINQNRKSNVLRAAINPIAGAKATIELEGAHAAAQSHVKVPTLYISVDETPNQFEQPATPKDTRSSGPQQPEQPIVPFDRFRIVRAEVKGNKRIIGDIKRAFTGKISQEQHFVKTTITDIKGGWLKLAPTEDLAPGEYALVEMMGTEGMNFYVWDFGVNPKAPANANPWKPQAKKPGEKQVAPDNPK
jgi:hypothetical protein